MDSTSTTGARDTSLTMTSNLSTDRLVCKTPQESAKSAKIVADENVAVAGPEIVRRRVKFFGSIVFLGSLQVACGLLMSVCGVLVITHDASLSHIGGGIWAGCLAVAAGTSGILSSADRWCPLKFGAQRMARTVFLALSLLSIAASQLVLVVAATGTARDFHKSEIIEIKAEDGQLDGIVQVLPSNYPAILSNILLVVICAVECLCAIVASYKSARDVCPCFRREAEENDEDEDNFKANLKLSSQALVDSWLGKHTPPLPHIYLVQTTPTSTIRPNKITASLPMTPIIALPQPMMGPTMYPLIPAPLGPVPSPIIRTHPRKKNYRLYKLPQQLPIVPKSRRPRSRGKSVDVPATTTTTEDVTKTYTGLDRTIAEEFIEICDSRNNSLCSSSSTCPSSCQCGGSQTGCQQGCSELGSRDYLIDKM